MTVGTTAGVPSPRRSICGAVTWLGAIACSDGRGRALPLLPLPPPLLPPPPDAGGGLPLPPWRPEGGVLRPRRVAADPRALTDLAAPPERRQWWRERMARCHALLDRAGVQR